MTLRWSLPCAAVAGVLAFFHTTSANACSGCAPARIYLEDGVAIPQNVRELLVRRGNLINSAELAEKVTLRDAAGSSVAVTVEDRSFENRGTAVIPAAPLGEGAYTLEVPDGCSGKVQTRSFTVGPSVAFPSAIGTLHAKPGPDTVDVDGGVCFKTLNVVSARIDIEAAASFQPFESSTPLQVFVDGQPWSGPIVEKMGLGFPTRRDPFVVYTACEGESEIRSLQPGKHLVEVRAHIEGAPADPTAASLEIDLQCPQSLPAKNDPSTTPASSDAGGCSVQSRRPSNLSWGAAIMAALGLAAFAKRRRVQ